MSEQLTLEAVGAFLKNGLVYVATFLAGAILNHLKEKFRNRTKQLQYTVVHNYLGSSASDTALGTMKVTFNDFEVTSLYLTKVTVWNPSGSDLDHLALAFFCDVDSAILTSHASKPGVIAPIEFHKPFLEAVENGSDKTLSFKRRDYLIPVLNRNDKIEVVFVVTNFKSKFPLMWASLDHKGISLKEVPLVQRFWGEPQVRSAKIGAVCALLIAPGIWWFSSQLNLDGWWNALSSVLSTVVGVMCLLLGVGLLKVWRMVVRVLS